MTKAMIKNGRPFKLVIEYDGSDFAGWQVQPNQRTVQGEIEKALKILTQKEVRVAGSGRTDAGVHALGQVVSFQVHSSLSFDELKKGLIGLLPKDISIVGMDELGEPFDARRDAISRTYRYVIARRSRAINRQYAWIPRITFSVESMQEASKYLVGEHDFTSFCKANGQTDNFISCVSDVHWQIDDGEIHFEITADRFFHHMVRSIVGTLMEVGRGKIAPEDFQQILKAKDRTCAGPTAPPQGLFLDHVEYGQNPHVFILNDKEQK
ncbi:tRNA pseudouridine(38-40) synthase TruA [bacterium]|nr:tRNA pseudouridine(38-40) synthase TruA [bacterium]